MITNSVPEDGSDLTLKWKGVWGDDEGGSREVGATSR